MIPLFPIDLFPPYKTKRAAHPIGTRGALAVPPKFSTLPRPMGEGRGEGAALCRYNGLTRDHLVDCSFSDSLAGGFGRLRNEEGLQSVTLSPWRAQAAYSSRSTRSHLKLLRL